MHRGYFFCTVIVGLFLLFQQKAETHPHAWIDLESKAVIDAEGNLVAVEQTWLFGPFYSGFILADIDTTDSVAVTRDLREIARQNLTSLREYDYFTVVQADGRDQVISDVETFETGVIDGRIYLKIEARLASPVPLQNSAVRYAIYDPTYYVEILHTQGSEPAVQTASDNRCAATLTTPAPTFEQLAYAASLDKTEKATTGLGSSFAEWVDISCQ